MKTKLIILAFLTLPLTLICQYKISIITVEKGTNIYDSFGHSAIRIQNDSLKIDNIYNYGLFEFNSNNSYLDFLLGTAKYSVEKKSFFDFLTFYKSENRTIKEQILAISEVEIIKIINLLENNIQPENKYYKYDFLTNNCSTKILDVLNNIIQEKTIYERKNQLT